MNSEFFNMNELTPFMRQRLETFMNLTKVFPEMETLNGDMYINEDYCIAHIKMTAIHEPNVTLSNILEKCEVKIFNVSQQKTISETWAFLRIGNYNHWTPRLSALLMNLHQTVVKYDEYDTVTIPFMKHYLKTRPGYIILRSSDERKQLTVSNFSEDQVTINFKDDNFSYTPFSYATVRSLSEIPYNSETLLLPWPENKDVFLKRTSHDEQELLRLAECLGIDDVNNPTEDDYNALILLHQKAVYME